MWFTASLVPRHPFRQPIPVHKRQNNILGFYPPTAASQACSELTIRRGIMSTTAFFLLPHLTPPPNPNASASVPKLRFRSRVKLAARRTLASFSAREPPMPPDPQADYPSPVDCVGTGSDVECYAVDATGEDNQLPPPSLKKPLLSSQMVRSGDAEEPVAGLVGKALDWALLVSPFFFWGTAMVAMKEVIPKTGPFFVSAFRLIPAGVILIGFAAARGRKLPAGTMAWLSITLFAVVDAAFFQGFLAEGLQKTSAGLGSVIIDSQPLTVAILAAILFGESIGVTGAAGLVLGVVGLLLLEVPALSLEGGSSSIWGSGEWWMFLAAQSMAVGTVMVRWVSKYSDPVMATGWHMVIGGLPLLAISILNHDPAFSGKIVDISSGDILALCYTSLFGSAISYGVFFYFATRGSLTRLSSLTFLTPMFASIFGYLYLGETFSPLQLVGALVTIVAIYMVNYRGMVDKS
ncbi:WAT1-related protein [Canna indica]|uniref:WAT1-related protein n=1 Tax=Canna indica TaxID=4628 RepID=A0AAQ3QCN6_9LILI|nr:WAT1-related protein [Canna indica]